MSSNPVDYWQYLRPFATERWTRLDDPGAIGRLIRELSWDKIDGRGLEDVLTTEVFQCLSFLPPEPFLSRVFGSIHDIDATGMSALLAAADSARFLTLPGDFSCGTAESALKVQPDVIIGMRSIVMSVEAKRLRPSLFEPTQLARQAVLLSNLTGEMDRYIWVVIDTPPPIKVGKFGRQSLADALVHGLEKIVPTMAPHYASQYEGKIGWSTWREIVDVCRTEHDKLPQTSDLRACTDRIISAMESAIRWHG
jgi:hypothetical protein